MKLGWLEPNGIFHEIAWGDHAKWAVEYTQKHYPYQQYKHMYNHHGGDFLVYNLGWVLINSPDRKNIQITHDIHKNMTKIQKEFLYDYFIQNNMYENAKLLFER